MLAFTLALICLLFWGVGDFLAILAVRRIGPLATSVWLAIVGIVIALPYAAANLELLQEYTAPVLALNILLGVIFVLSNLTYSYAVRSGNAAVVTSIGASFTAWTAILASWLFSEDLSSIQWLCVGVVTLGLVLSNLNFKELCLTRLRFEESAYQAALATVGWTFYFALIRIAIAQVGWFWPTFLSLLCFPSVLLVEHLAGNNISLRFPKQQVVLVLVCGVLIRAAEFLYNAALRHGFTALVVPVAGSYPLIIVLLSMVFLRERLSAIQFSGVALTLVAIVILGATAS